MSPMKTARPAVKAKAGPRFASLSAEMLSAGAGAITRPGARIYSRPGEKGGRAPAGPPDAPEAGARIAVTFRMERTEFHRLRRGAQIIGVRPRDVVHRAIKNCLDAYGVDAPKKGANKPAH